MKVSNLFSDIPAATSQEWLEQILSQQHVRIERIVSNGHCSPEGFWYDQHWGEWVLLVKGQAGLIFEGNENIVELKPGDHLFIPAHVRHRVAWTAPDGETIWLAVLLAPEDDGQPQSMSHGHQKPQNAAAQPPQKSS